MARQPPQVVRRRPSRVQWDELLDYGIGVDSSLNEVTEVAGIDW